MNNECINRWLNPKSVLVAHFFYFFIIVERDKCYGEEDFF